MKHGGKLRNCAFFQFFSFFVNVSMEPKKNTDLILRENLAIQRTEMSNQRTFLSFLRTALYLSIAALTITELLTFRYKQVVSIAFGVMSAMVLAAGIWMFYHQKKKIDQSRQHVGGLVDDYRP